MPFELTLPAALASQGWKAKIREKERLEPPHVTIIRRTQAWRFNLRTMSFMDGQPDPASVPKELVQHIEANIEVLCFEWDTKYPHNPVRGDGHGSGDDE